MCPTEYSRACFTSENPLWAKRNISVHRGRPPVKIRLFLQESIALTSGLVVVAPGATVSIETIPLGPRIVSPMPKGAREIYFDDFPTEDIIDFCEEGFQQIKDMVEEVEKEFGNS